jgi:hypothetical protein
MAWGVWGGSPPPTGKSKVYLKPFIPAITSYIRLYPAISGYIQLRPRSSLSSLLSVHIAKDALMALYQSGFDGFCVDRLESRRSAFSTQYMFGSGISSSSSSSSVSSPCE